MFRFLPLKNMCSINSDIWFLSKGINALFKYCGTLGKVQYVALPGDINQDYVYLATYHYDDKIYMPPVYGNGFGEYDISKGTFRQICTPNSQKDCNFGASVVDGEMIYCVPNFMDGPFVTFNMGSGQEEQAPIFFPKDYITDTNLPYASQMGADGLVYGLIYPISVIYTVDFKSGKFRFFHNDSISSPITSFYVESNHIYFSTADMIFITDLELNILAETKNVYSDSVCFLGALGDKVFIDVLNSPVKALVKYNDGDIVFEKFDETNEFKAFSKSRFGNISYDVLEGKYVYFSAGSNGIYEYKNGNVQFTSFELEEQDYVEIINKYDGLLNGEQVLTESEVFGVDEFINGVCRP